MNGTNAARSLISPAPRPPALQNGNRRATVRAIVPSTSGILSGVLTACSHMPAASIARIIELKTLPLHRSAPAAAAANSSSRILPPSVIGFTPFLRLVKPIINKLLTPHQPRFRRFSIFVRIAETERYFRFTFPENPVFSMP